MSKIFLNKYKDKYTEAVYAKAKKAKSMDLFEVKTAWLMVEEILFELGYKDCIDVRKSSPFTTKEIRFIHNKIVEENHEFNGTIE